MSDFRLNDKLIDVAIVGEVRWGDRNLLTPSRKAPPDLRDTTATGQLTAVFNRHGFYLGSLRIVIIENSDLLAAG